jgi:N-acylneuraminate cytidylyltransferase
MLNNEGYMESFVQDETEPYNWPRQDLPILYFQTGDIEISRRETLLSGSVTGDRPYPLIIDHEEMVDIDNWQDLDLAAKRIQ